MEKTFGDRVRSFITWTLSLALLVIVGLGIYQVKTGDNILGRLIDGQPIITIDGKPVVAIPEAASDPEAEKVCGKGARTFEVQNTGGDSYALVGNFDGLYPNVNGQTVFYIKESIPVGTIGFLFQGKDAKAEYDKLLAFKPEGQTTNHECKDTGCPALWNTSLSISNSFRNEKLWTKDGSDKRYLKNVPLAYYQAFDSWFMATYKAAKAGKPLPRCVTIPALKDMAEISGGDKAELEGGGGNVAKVDPGQKLPVVAKAAPAETKAPPAVSQNPPASTEAKPLIDLKFVAPQIIATPYVKVQAGSASLEFIAQQVNELGATAYVRADSCTGNQPNDWSKVMFTIPTRPDVYLEADLSGIYQYYQGGGCTSIMLVNQSGAGYAVSDTAGNSHFSLAGFSSSPVNEQPAPQAQAVNPAPVQPTWKPVTLSALAGEDWSAPLYVSQGGDRACTETGAFANPVALYVSNGMQGYKVDLTGFSQYLVLPHCEEVVFGRSAPSVPYLQIGTMYVSWLTKTPPTPQPSPTPNLVWNWPTFMSQVIAPYPNDHAIWVQCGPINGNEIVLAPMGLCDDWRFRSRVTVGSADLSSWDRSKPLMIKYGSQISGTIAVPGSQYWWYGPVK